MTCRFIMLRKTEGLAADARAYAPIFARYFKIVDNAKEKVSVNIHIELLVDDMIPLARMNVLMVNQEITFDSRHSTKNFDKIAYFICKTNAGFQETNTVISKLKLTGRAVLLGHTSPFEACALNRKPDWTRILHLGGSSTWKQTDVVLRAWLRHPEWPELVVTCHGRCDANVKKYMDVAPIRAATNIRWLEYVKSIRALQCAVKTHLCPSMIEGFGHYINEARASGALVITTDHAPMNELVDEKSGVLIPCRLETKRNADLTGTKICHADIETTMTRVFTMSLIDKQARADQARRRYLADTAVFETRCATFAQKLAS